MKISKNKIIVSTLALAMGAALAGSVSGTVAWFQYSTRAQAAFIGTSAHCSEMLEIKSLGPTATAYKSELLSSEVKNMDGYGTDLQPISSGDMALDAGVGRAVQPGDAAARLPAPAVSLARQVKRGVGGSVARRPADCFLILVVFFRYNIRHGNGK